MDLGLDNATAVIVGGSRGMGLATARCLAADGARTAVVGRTSADVQQAAAELTELGSPDAIGLTADVRDPAEVERLFDTVAERWDGQLNILVNTVGPAVQGGIETLSDDQWREAVDDGVLSVVHCVRAALPLLRNAEWARIVNFSAQSTRRQSATLVAYTAAKAMLTSVSKNLSLSLAPEGILVNTVSPGSVVTGALVDWARSRGIEDEDPRALAAAIAAEHGHPSHLARAGLPEEIGPVAAFLASRRNSYMTGADVNVDGGTDFV